MNDKANRQNGGSASQASVKQLLAHSLTIQAVEIDNHCTGSRWQVADLDRLACIVAIVAMGQAQHAARIISDLLPAEPLLQLEELKADAKRRLTIKGDSPGQRDAARSHRDGLIFESLSWIAARQAAIGRVLLRDPHLSPTSQGLDGLMIEIDEHSSICRATIFEDKCSVHPRDKFRDEIMPTFKAYHEKQRSPELLAAAAALIAAAGLDSTAATNAAARVLDPAFRTYRGSLAITNAQDTPEGRRAIFSGYEELQGLKADQRVGATFVTPNELRPWFDEFARRTVEYIEGLK